jgi:hypothetical protein
MSNACDHGFLRRLIFALTLVLLAAGNSRALAADGNTNDAFKLSLIYSLSTNAAAHATGHNPGDDMSVLANWHYGDYNQTNLGLITNAVWSTNFWLHGVQGLSATCIGFSNGLGGQGLVTMVSPRHYLFASHMHPEGYLIPFLDTNNVIHWRKTLERMEVTAPFATKVSMDTSVGILDADLPPSVGFMPVVPANLSVYIPESKTLIVQGIGMNQDMKYFGQPMGFSDRPFVVWNSRFASPAGVPTSWNVALRSGDSSNPEMLLVDNQLVLLSHNYGIQGGPNYAYLFDAINKTMRQLSKHNHVRPDYQLTDVSFRNWPRIVFTGDK